MHRQPWPSRRNLGSTVFEITYPTKPVSKSYSAWGEHGELARCHYCGAYDLDAWETRRARRSNTAAGSC